MLALLSSESLYIHYSYLNLSWCKTGIVTLILKNAFKEISWNQITKQNLVNSKELNVSLFCAIWNLQARNSNVKVSTRMCYLQDVEVTSNPFQFLKSYRHMPVFVLFVTTFSKQLSDFSLAILDNGPTPHHL